MSKAIIEKHFDKISNAIKVASEFNDDLIWESVGAINPIPDKSGLTLLDHQIDDMNNVLIGIEKDNYFMKGYYKDECTDLINEQMDFLHIILIALGYKHSPKKENSYNETFDQVYISLHSNELDYFDDDSSTEKRIMELGADMANITNEGLQLITGSTIASVKNFIAFLDYKNLNIKDIDDLGELLEEYISLFK